jgi:hypothetical protein
MLAIHPRRLGLLLDAGAVVTANARGQLRPRRRAPDGARPAVLVLDARAAREVDFSTRLSRPDSVGPRQSVAITGIVAHLLDAGWQLDLRTGAVTSRNR